MPHPLLQLLNRRNPNYDNEVNVVTSSLHPQNQSTNTKKHLFSHVCENNFLCLTILAESHHSVHFTTLTLTSYSKYRGMVTSTNVMMSGGVMIACGTWQACHCPSNSYFGIFGNVAFYNHIPEIPKYDQHCWGYLAIEALC